MGITRILSIILSLLAAGAISGLTYWIEVKDSTQDQINLGLRIARQIVTQVETLSLYAQEKQEQDPVSWAVRFFKVGMDQRPIEITPIKSEFIINNSENYEFNSKNGEFNYSKIFIPEHGKGVRVQIDLGYTGFLGSHGPLKNDLALGGLFLLLFNLMRLIIRPKASLSPPELLEKQTENIAERSHEREISEFLMNWSTDAKSTLTQLGLHIRDLIRTAQILATASAKSRDLIKTDADAAFNSCNEVFNATHDMDIFITKTTEALLSEARLLQNLKNKATQLDKAQKKADSIKW